MDCMVLRWGWRMVRAGLTTERVVETADPADSVGFDQVTISAPARGFGVRDAGPYSHVRNLHDLRTEVVLFAAGEFIDRVEAAVAGRAGKDALIAFADAYRSFVPERPGRYEATRMRIAPAVAAGPRVPADVETIGPMLRAYGLTEPGLADAARLLRSTLHGHCASEVNGGFGAPVPCARPGTGP